LIEKHQTSKSKVRRLHPPVMPMITGKNDESCVYSTA